MFRIPWKHAGKQDFRKDQDAAIFKAWAEFKGRLSDNNPASWKTRLRCALKKSPEFCEVVERAQLDISEPYKVYRLVPPDEQGALIPERKCEKSVRKCKRRRNSNSSDDVTADEDVPHVKHMKTAADDGKIEPIAEDIGLQPEHLLDNHSMEAPLSEIQLDVSIQESVAPPEEDKDSLHVVVHYLGQKVLTRLIQGADVRVLYVSSSSPAPPRPAPDACFPRIHLPEPPPSVSAGRVELLSLLPFMEKGILLTSTRQGVYGRRFCRGRVFWTGPHGSSPALSKMERNSESVLLFSKDAFKRQLDNFCVNGGDPPQCSFTLCFGEELSCSEDPSEKFITVQVTLPWAEQQVRSACSPLEAFGVLESPLEEITLNLVAEQSDEVEAAAP
ncbi:interferon regulatory factor 9 isoform X2 [Syngnathus scovelli]|nr:interferon regulatory factor 9 isoform X2 [Syngnathus scovelli]